MNLTIGSKIEAIVVWIDGNKIGLQFKENDMTIDHAGIRYIGIPEEELREMNKELEGYRKDRLTNTVEAIKESLDPNEWYRGGGSSVSSDLDALDCGNALRCDDIVLYKVEDTYFRAQGLSEENTKNWAIVKAWILERRSNWSRARMEEHTAPHPNVLKGVAMQMPYAQNKEMAKKPYTFDGLTDGLSPEDKKRALKKAGMNNLDAFGGPKTTMPEVDEKGQMEKPDPDSLAGAGPTLYQPDKMPTESLVERFKPICEALVAEDFDLVEELIKQFKTRKHPATPSESLTETEVLKRAVDSGRVIERTIVAGTLKVYKKDEKYYHEDWRGGLYDSPCFEHALSGDPIEWHIKPSSPAVNEVIDGLKLGKAFVDENGIKLTPDMDSDLKSFRGATFWGSTPRGYNWSDLPKFLEGKKWERV